MTLAAQWEVYIIQTISGKLYTGITNNLKRRISQHNSQKGAQFFYFSKPERLVFREQHPNRSTATKREIEIKKLNRSQKLDLIQQWAALQQKHNLEQVDPLLNAFE